MFYITYDEDTGRWGVAYENSHEMVFCQYFDTREQAEEAMMKLLSDLRLSVENLFAKPI